MGKTSRSDERWLDLDQRNLFLQALLGLDVARRRLEPLRLSALRPAACTGPTPDESVVHAILGALVLARRLDRHLGPTTPASEPEKEPPPEGRTFRTRRELLR